MIRDAELGDPTMSCIGVSLLYPIKKVIVQEGKVVGFGLVHLTSEVTLSIDKSLPKLTRARLIKELFDCLLPEILAMGLEDTHVFVTEDEEHFPLFLEKHLNFVRASGVPMYHAGGIHG